MKKSLKNLIICFILIIIFIIIFLIIQLQKNKSSYILKLLNKGIENINYCINTDDGNKINYYKNIQTVILSDGSIIYEDLENNESIYISEKDKTIEFYKNDGIKDNVHYNKYIDYFNEENYQYRYEGSETIDSQKCIVISFLNKKEGKDGSQLLMRFWINKKLGLIEKIESFSVKDNIETKQSSTKYNMHLNNVSEKDIQKPDISNYGAEYEIK